MPRNKKFQGDMTAIGVARKPPFARLPDGQMLFAGRSKRFTHLQPTSPVADFVGFLAMLAKTQQATAHSFAHCGWGDALRQDAARFGMPPLDRARFVALPLFEDIMDDFFSRLGQEKLNQASGQALAALSADKANRAGVAANLNQGFVVAQDMAQHVLIMAAMQIAMTLATSSLHENQLKRLEKNLCPACGGTHTASMVVGWNEAEGTRFCSCLYCGTLWHQVRIKCTFCEATGGIEYREIEGGPGSILAETCKSCGHYCKLIDQQKNISMDVFADDIGSIALDALMQDAGTYSRGAFNPFMMGY